MTQLLQALVNGVTDGAFLAMMALGITLVFGVAKVVNIAHGDMLTAGAYGTYWTVGLLGLPLPIAALGGAGLAIVVGLASYLLIFSRIGDRPATALLSSIGVSMFIRGLVALTAGNQQIVFDIPLWRAWKVLGVRIMPMEALICAVSLAVILATHLVLRYTRIGAEMRAVADNESLARTTGIDPRRVNIVTWVLALAVAGIAGFLLGMRSSVYPDMGWALLMPALAAAVLGGMGSPYGAIFAGLIIGIGQNVALIWIDGSYKLAFSFVILILVLLVKPTGLAGRKEIAR